MDIEGLHHYYGVMASYPSPGTVQRHKTRNVLTLKKDAATAPRVRSILLSFGHPGKGPLAIMKLTILSLNFGSRLIWMPGDQDYPCGLPDRQGHMKFI